MDSKLILIRGMSASGKTSIANHLKKKHAEICCISQDMLRIDILNRHPRAESLIANLLEETAAYMLAQGLTVVVEGTLNQEVFGETLGHLMGSASEKVLIYLDAPQKVSIERINTIRTRIGRENIKPSDFDRWFTKSQPLGLTDEIFIDTGKLSLVETIQQVEQVSGL